MKSISRLIALLLCLCFVFCGCMKKTPTKDRDAYEVALENGFVGTEEEWLASLKGKSAYELWLDNGNSGTVEDFLNSLSTTINHHTVNITAPDTISAAVSKALMSVVSVYAEFTQTVMYRDGYRWETREENYSAAGSGVIYQLNKTSGDAYIITNYHVVYDIQNESTETGISHAIKLYLYGMEYDEYAIPASYVGGSLYYDIAILRVSGSDVLRTSSAMAAELLPKEKDITVGQTAIAVGNPEAYGISATSGIVCVDSEHITMRAADNSGNVTMRVMRIDTPINSGNSGGGLFDSQGRLIGITNAKIVDGQTENIAYAIPVQVADNVAQNIIHYCADGTKDRVQRCILGITLGTESSKAIYDSQTGQVNVEEVVSVSSVTEASLADGLLAVDDVIQSITINGENYKITRTFKLIDAMLNVRVGQTVVFHILRAGKAMDVAITISADCVTPY